MTGWSAIRRWGHRRLRWWAPCWACYGSALAHTAMRAILDQVPLSQRQRHALEAALQTSASAATTTPDPLAWEPIRWQPLARLLDTLTHLRPQHVAPLIVL